MDIKIAVILFSVMMVLQTRGQDREYHIPTNSFLDRVLDFTCNDNSFYQTRKDSYYTVLPFRGPRNQLYRQELLKTAHGFYVYYSATGILYKYSGRIGVDSLRFQRMDSTEHYGYNINCYPFTNGEDVYNLGGYGFWQWTGHLRKFDFNSHEWTIAKTNREVPVITREMLPCIWYNKKNAQLFTLTHFTGNESIRTREMNKPIKIDSVMRLDLQSLDWISLGALTPEALELIENAQIVANQDDGLICYSNNRFLVLDLVKNEILLLESAGSMNPVKFTTRNKDYISFARDSVIYFYEFKDETLDSLVLNKKNLKNTGQYIYRSSSDFSLNIWISIMVILVLMVLGFFTYKKLYSSSKSSNSIPIVEVKPSPSLQSYAGGIYIDDKVFTPVEMDLIYKILQNSSELNQRTTVDEVNYVLGVASKTTDMQKRKRSNTIRSVNDKYAILIKNPDYQLIKRERNEQDARSNEFYIDEADFKYFGVDGKTVKR